MTYAIPGHLEYGTQYGIEDNFKSDEYARLFETGELTTAKVERARRKANAKIDSDYLAKIVPVSSLPLATPPGSIHGISDDCASYFLLLPLYRKQDPNVSDWVEEIWNHALNNLLELLKSPESIVDAAGLAVTGTGIAVEYNDPIFGTPRTKDGTASTTQYQESQKVW